ncbi:MAG: hypothetical protein PF503_13440 [Desulfobacula sp.]|jgi:hypothetical protein|nr:hypothetical protein [Desulfobacula sp.]
MNLKVWGPILFATMLFIVGAAIKIIAFKSDNVFFEMPPDFALWAVGIMFSLAVSEQTQFGGRTYYDISKNKSGTGILVDYKISLPDELSFSPKYIYFFVYSMMIWILTILLSGEASALNSIANYSIYKITAINLVSLALAGTSIGVSIRSLLEVSS